MTSRSVWEVMGPMEMRWISCGRLRLEASSKARRFVAVELLVKVMADGHWSREEKSWRMAAMESEGMRVR